LSLMRCPSHAALAREILPKAESPVSGPTRQHGSGYGIPEEMIF
jgi:hypothetical protein